MGITKVYLKDVYRFGQVFRLDLDNWELMFERPYNCPFCWKVTRISDCKGFTWFLETFSTCKVEQADSIMSSWLEECYEQQCFKKTFMVRKNAPWY